MVKAPRRNIRYILYVQVCLFYDGALGYYFYNI